MIRKHITDLKPGMVLSRDVDSLNSGAILVSENTVLDKQNIRRIINYNIKYVYLYDEHNLPDEIKGDLLELKYEKFVDKMERVFFQVKLGKQPNLLNINNELNELIDEVFHVHNILGRMGELQQKDDYTFNHSINVAILATILGKWLGYSRNRVKQLALCGLFHDIGKLHIPEVILNKPGKLSGEEFEKIKEHTIIGYNILKKTVGISKNVALGVLQHHEREGGTGYPLGLHGGEIHEYAKIIAVCDVYDAITSDRVYKERVSPLFAAEILERKCFDCLNPKITMVFLNKVARFYVGSTVLLSNEEVGDIVYIHPQAPTKAIVKVGDKFIDFLQPQDIRIIDIIK